MSSIVAICNLALSNIGKENINDLQEASAEAKACRQFYNHTRRTLLQSYPWHFAGRTLSLAELTNDKPGQWAHKYTIPTDCLKVRWVRPKYSEDDPRQTRQEILAIPYEIEAGNVYCDLSPAFLRYTFDLEDPSKFSPLFGDALSWHLAVRLAMPMTRDPKIRADAWNVANLMTGQAQMADANDERHSSDHVSEFVEVRD